MPWAERRLRRWARQLGRSAATQIGAGLHQLFGRRARGALGVLLYHRIAAPVRGLPAPLYNVVPRRFRQQIQGILARGYQAWPLGKVLDFHEAGRTIPEKIFVVTFDDGYGNVYQNAWPILKELQVPATIFLTTGWLDRGGPFPFDVWGMRYRDRLPPVAYRPLSTAECQELLASGLIEFGSHTHSHADFRGRPEEFLQDLHASVAVLRERFGIGKMAFAFPFGYEYRRTFGEELALAARRDGVRCSLSATAELVRVGSDPFDWGRFGVEPTETAAHLAGKLDGWFGLFRDVWVRLSRSGAVPSRNANGRLVGTGRERVGL